MHSEQKFTLVSLERCTNGWLRKSLLVHRDLHGVGTRCVLRGFACDGGEADLISDVIAGSCHRAHMDGLSTASPPAKRWPRSRRGCTHPSWFIASTSWQLTSSCMRVLSITKQVRKQQPSNVLDVVHRPTSCAVLSFPCLHGA